jgi:hypothetical protein|tara:strand:+ start:251 stop:436 length:186 start_codon:yes stop_codon:yes gene_type:complete
MTIFEWIVIGLLVLILIAVSTLGNRMITGFNQVSLLQGKANEELGEILKKIKKNERRKKGE